MYPKFGKPMMWGKELVLEFSLHKVFLSNVKECCLGESGLA